MAMNGNAVERGSACSSCAAVREECNKKKKNSQNKNLPPPQALNFQVAHIRFTDKKKKIRASRFSILMMRVGLGDAKALFVKCVSS